VVPDVLVSELGRIRKRGYARSVDETELGMSSLAVPVRDTTGGSVVAAISMVGPTARVVGDNEAGHIGVLQAGARRLTEAIELGRYAVPGRSATRRPPARR
jgi:DNA-binding IclR family transcriptional regulator